MPDSSCEAGEVWEETWDMVRLQAPGSRVGAAGMLQEALGLASPAMACDRSSYDAGGTLLTTGGLALGARA